MTVNAPATGRSWLETPTHRQWLYDHAASLLDFYQYASIDPGGGFFELDDEGRPRDLPARQLFITTRAVHCYALAHLMGKPGAAALVDHGIEHLDGALADRRHGGWFWSAGAEGVADRPKQHYGHAFVILAGASATVAGHPAGRRLLENALAVHDERFWDDDAGAGVEEYRDDWSELSGYRGQNSNMHLTEAFMAAYEATGDSQLLDRAHRIADKLINQLARGNGWRLAEHYSSDWHIELDYNRDDPYNLFRPYGSTTGHWLEWARLVLQLWQLRGKREAWMPQAARALFDRAVEDSWDVERGGFCFTVDWDGTPFNRDRYWWTTTEAIGAAAHLLRLESDERYEALYRQFWDFADAKLIDHEHGSWFHQLDPENRPTEDPWFGKPDLYHTLQACLVGLLPVDVGFAVGLRDGRLRLT